MDTEEEEDKAQVGEELVVVDEEEEEPGIALQAMTRWHAIAVGYVAIWPATVPRMRRHREVAFLALSVVSLLNPCRKAQEDVVVEVALYASVALMLFMMRKETSIQLMMLVNFMCHWMRYKLGASLLRWKIKKTQKTKKNLCQCSLCWCYSVFNWHKFAKRKEKEKCEGNL